MISVFYFYFKALFYRYVSEVCLRRSSLSSKLHKYPTTTIYISLPGCSTETQVQDDVQNHAFTFPLKTDKSFSLSVLVTSLPFTHFPKPHIWDNLHVCLFNHPHSIYYHSVDLDYCFSDEFPTVSVLHLPLFRSSWIPATPSNNTFPFLQSILSKRLIQWWHLAFKVFPKVVLVVRIDSGPLGGVHTVTSPALGPLVCYWSSSPQTQAIAEYMSMLTSTDSGLFVWVICSSPETQNPSCGSHAHFHRFRRVHVGHMFTTTPLRPFVWATHSLLRLRTLHICLPQTQAKTECMPMLTSSGSGLLAQNQCSAFQLQFPTWHSYIPPQFQ